MSYINYTYTYHRVNYMSNNILNIILHPNPILRRQSTEITLEMIKTPEFQELCTDMVATMNAKDGAGLSAPQIGKNIRLIMVNSKTGPLIMINPIMTRKSLLKEWDTEGCLSIVNKEGNIAYGEVKRHRNVDCKFVDPQGKERKISGKGMMARVIQHEIDHLNGVLFIDKARNMEPYAGD